MVNQKILKLEIFVRRNYEKQYSILKTSFENLSTKFSEDDKIQQLRTALLLALKTLIQVGDETVISPKAPEILRQIENHLQYDKISGIVCLHELFLKIFGNEEPKKEKKKICDFENISKTLTINDK
jgi:hypothetical protein